MELEQSSLYREVQAVINSGANPVHYSWSAQFHANKNNYTVLKVQQVDIVRDYENNYSDVIKVTIVIQKGMYWSLIYPYSDSLEMTLFKYPLAEVGTNINLGQPLETERYTAIVNSQNTPLLQSSGGNTPTPNTLDYTALETVEVELVDRALNQMRMMSAGNTLRNCTPETAIRTIMTTESQKVKVDQARVIQGVDMIPSNNQTVRDHVVIPQGIPLTHIPQYIHQKCGGVYSAGLGYYLQNNFWFIYPCYDPTRSSNSATTLTIINIPKNKFVGIERTYRQSGSNIVVLATGDVKFQDRSNHMQLNLGNGVRFADAAKLFDKFVTVKNGIAIASRGLINTEATTVKRPTGLNNTQQSPRALNANPFLEYSEMAKRNGAMMGMAWENSNPGLIKPGMLVTILYLDNENISQMSGVLLKTHHHVRMQGTGMTDTRHITDSVLSIFVQRPTGNGTVSGTGGVLTAN